MTRVPRQSPDPTEILKKKLRADVASGSRATYGDDDGAPRVHGAPIFRRGSSIRARVAVPDQRRSRTGRTRRGTRLGTPVSDRPVLVGEESEGYYAAC